MKYLKNFESLLCNFTDEEFETIKDMFQIYIDKWNMVPIDGGFIWESNDVQYYIAPYRNIGIEILCTNPIKHIYRDILDNFSQRLKSRRFYISNHEYNEGNRYGISFTIMKNN